MPSRLTLWLTALVMCLGLSSSLSCSAQDDPKPKKEKDAKPVVDKDGKPLENPFPNRFPAPSFEGGSAWLNTSGEITLKDVRGKVVLVDFWTYCCINCMHVLPDLKFLEKKYPNELVVIGCHSAKFDNEKDTEAIRRAIVRYEIEHPVINDSEMAVWRKFSVRSWPTLVLIDPEGQYCGYISGEGNREVLDEVIQKLLAYHKAKGTLDTTPVRFDLESNRVIGRQLKFPGKVLADEPSDRLFISDSNHNRIVVTSLAGKLVDVIGSGQLGHKDGGYAEAAFDHPQGMVLRGNVLYVADTENHLLRTVDLKAKRVATLAGTGVQARGRDSGGALLKTALNSPWDLEIEGDTLFIAMAGPHQLWSHTLGSERIEVFSGSGREDIVNGSHEAAAYAQPSGISSDGKFLYIADSEGSSIRKVAIDPKGKVTTVVGEHDLPAGRTLFEFGDVDGIGNKARLQHPLGVLHHAGKLYVADSYNHKIKRVDLETRESTTWLGDGKIGDGLNPLRLSEPAGMTIAGSKLYVADTNNHRIVVVDTKAAKPVGTVLEIEGLTAPKSLVGIGEPGFAAVGDQKPIALPAQTIAGEKPLRLQVSFQLPEDYKLNPEYPVRVKVTAEGPQSLIAAEQLGKAIAGKVTDGVAAFDVPLAAATGKAKLTIAVTYSYCRGGMSGVCKLHTARWTVPVEAAAGGAKQIELTAQPTGQ